jgi:hypothetical protein
LTSKLIGDKIKQGGSMKEKLICDCRGGCVAIYKESRKNETNGCHSDDKRNIAYSSKDALFNGSFWTMDEETQQIFKDMVQAYNNELNLNVKD